MFRSSPACLFRPLPALMKLRIHQPLPLNARESTALLNLLTSSFRSNLDAEHPTSESENLATKGITNRTRRRSGSGQVVGNHADRHMQSVLTNPLFNSIARNQSKTPSDEVLHDPMETFERAAGMGMMNMRYATACLLATKKRILVSSVLDVREGMLESGASLRVLRWMKSSGLDNNLEFFKDSRFIDALMDFIVAEGLQEAAWKWVKMSFDNLPATYFLTGPDLRMAHRAMAWPLYCLVKAETNGQESLDAAFLCMSRAAGYLKGLSAQDMRPILGRAGVDILRKTLSSHSDRPSPTETHFESFLSLLPTFLKTYDLYIAHLQLIHPTKPDAELAVNYLRSINLQNKEAHLSERQISLGLDTARFLLQQQNQSEVNWILSMLQSRFQREMEEGDRTHQLEQAKAEATSLDLLARLGFS